MTEQQIKDYCASQGVPFNTVGDRLRVLDLTQLPDVMRPLFDGRGIFKQVVEVEVESVTEATVEGESEIAETGKPKPAPKKKGGKK